jgi:putative Mn2+ efflux pump MntP
MDVLAIFVVAVGLSMDCVAVAVASSLGVKGVNARQAATMGLFFGGFQALMLVIGWLLGASLIGLISAFDHWIAFGLLLVIGLNMIYEAFQGEGKEAERDPLHIMTLTVMALATSIDALAVGLSYSLLDVSILLPALMAGAVSFVLSALGAIASGRLGLSSGKWARLLGGSILIVIGLRILLEHIFV